ncbi:MAG: 30S ribosomal protein S11 [Candidatus Portnoybacteria bacterium]|jgi:small subunit ribosomal protein S11|nr:30S ribosomal protein S11 [Candidatus Portnoybacteria bacterium]
MGKKKIQKQTEQEALKETEVLEQAQRKASVQQAAKAKLVDRAKVFIQSTYNNTLISIADKKGNLLAWSSAGSLGFKGPKKATPYAASKVVETLLEKVKKMAFQEIEIYVKGIGSGREAAVRSLASRGLNIVLIKDITPVPHNGCRPRKPRRV